MKKIVVSKGSPVASPIPFGGTRLWCALICLLLMCVPMFQKGRTPRLKASISSLYTAVKATSPDVYIGGYCVVLQAYAVLPPPCPTLQTQTSPKPERTILPKKTVPKPEILLRPRPLPPHPRRHSFRTFPARGPPH